MSAYHNQILDNATEWIDQVFKESVKLRASDIHIEPHGDAMVTRFRVDGVMQKIGEQPIQYLDAVISRLKVLSNLNSVEKSIPQDGHLHTTLRWDNMTDSSMAVESGLESEVNFRVSIMPTTMGEVAVLRALNRKESVMSLESLGFSTPSLEGVKRILQSPSGMILMTGPSGSGKTTTLYSLMNRYHVDERAIITLEDPVEYQFLEFRQTQIANDRGLTFGVGLRAILRQDPDVIMVGEIRDAETADIAVSAALSGRLVFSTFHSNDIAGVIFRMREMGIGKIMMASALAGIISERLVRRICNYCKKEAEPPHELLKLLHIVWSGGKVYKGKGCDRCSMTGYYGRVGIFEVLVMNQDMKNLIMQNISVESMQKRVQDSVVETLMADGFDKVGHGITTLEEVLRVAI